MTVVVVMVAGSVRCKGNIAVLVDGCDSTDGLYIHIVAKAVAI